MPKGTTLDAAAREKIAKLKKQGLTQAVVAYRLGVSVKTVKTFWNTK